MLLSEGVKEEGLFRLAAGASVLKRLKQTMASDPRSLQEFCSDPHAVAGARSKEPWVGGPSSQISSPQLPENDPMIVWFEA